MIRVIVGIQDDRETKDGRLIAELDLREPVVRFYVARSPSDPGSLSFTVFRAELRALFRALEAT